MVDTWLDRCSSVRQSSRSPNPRGIARARSESRFQLVSHRAPAESWCALSWPWWDWGGGKTSPRHALRDGRQIRRGQGYSLHVTAPPHIHQALLAAAEPSHAAPRPPTARHTGSTATASPNNPRPDQHPARRTRPLPAGYAISARNSADTTATPNSPTSTSATSLPRTRASWSPSGTARPEPARSPSAAAPTPTPARSADLTDGASGSLRVSPWWW